MNNTTFTPTADVLAIGTYYIATNYGIHPDNDASTNTEKFQKLVNQVSSNGGGTIYFPVGTYLFGIGGTLPHKNNIPYAIEMKSNVSIIGENMEKTILKQICATKNNTSTPQPYSLFVYLNSANEPTKINGVITHPETFIPITGCTYSNFTVDASETDAVFEYNEDGSVKDYPYYAKAFYYQFVKDCVFRDLILRDTIATALGIDYLDRVQIENVHCYNCGRGYVKGATGSSGIGIGTGGWDNENFYIHNCTCEKSGQFGIFIENQLYLGWGPKNGSLLAKGCIISNCITRNGNNNGIGIRGGKNVTVIGCESYENNSDGFYIDGKCQNVKIHSCSSSYNKGSGIHVNTTPAASTLPQNVNSTSYRIILSNNSLDTNSEDGIKISPESTLSTMVIRDNHLFSNAQKGINIENDVIALVLIGNYESNSTIGLNIASNTYQDCVIKDNIFRGAIQNLGTFTGVTSFNDLP